MAAIYLVRHGQASFGAEDYDVLSETGVRQARRLGEALRGRIERADVVLSGGMRRHLATAEACLAAMGDARAPVVDPGWDEYDHDEVLRVFAPRFADRTALATELAAAADPAGAFRRIFDDALARWIAGEHDADYREAWGAFVARVEAALERLRAGLGRGGTALVFTSGGPIAVVCGTLLALPRSEALGLAAVLVNGGVTKVVAGGGRGLFLSSFNEHGYLERPGDRIVTYR